MKQSTIYRLLIILLGFLFMAIVAESSAKGNPKDTCILKDPPLFNSPLTIQSSQLCKGLLPFTNTDYQQIYCQAVANGGNVYNPSSLCVPLIPFTNTDLWQIYCALKADSGGGGGSGTVTSVGLSTPSVFTVSGSPVTTSGTLSFAATNSNGFLKNTAGVLTWSAASSSIGPVKDSAWLLFGNYNTNTTTNWIGTNDAHALQFKTDGHKSGWIDYTIPGNTFFGYLDGKAITSGYANTLFGFRADTSITTGEFNTAIGTVALNANISGSYNCAIGDDALGNNKFGTGNTAIGVSTLEGGSISDNTAVGDSSLSNMTAGIYNTAIGYYSGASNSNGSSNTYIGNYAGFGDQGSSNTYVGDSAGVNLAGSSGIFNTCVGYNSGAGNTTGSENTAIGGFALAINTTGFNNVAIGGTVLVANNGGIDNTGVGTLCFNSSGQWSSCTAIGSYAGSQNQGDNNIFLGDSAGVNVTNLNNAIFIGNANTTTTGILTRRASGIIVDTNLQTGNSGHIIFSPSSGGIINLQNNQVNIINPASTLTSLTINLPISPINNDVIILLFKQTISLIHWSGNYSTIVTTYNAGTTVYVTYDSGTSSWY